MNHVQSLEQEDFVWVRPMLTFKEKSRGPRHYHHRRGEAESYFDGLVGTDTALVPHVLFPKKSCLGSERNVSLLSRISLFHTNA